MLAGVGVLGFGNREGGEERCGLPAHEIREEHYSGKKFRCNA